MNFIQGVFRTIRTRPFYIWKYTWEAFLFTLNYIRWKAIPCDRIKVGRNVPVLSPGCFVGERPNSRIEIGDDFLAYYRVKINAWGAGRIKIGNHCTFVSGARIDCRDRVEIGDYVLFGGRIADFEGHPTDPEKRAAEIEYSHGNGWPSFSKNESKASESYTPEFESRPVIVEDKAWIAIDTLILKRVRIGYGSVVAAGLVVTHDVPPYSVVAGNAARVVKTLPGAGGEKR